MLFRSIVASNVKGHADLVENGENGWLYNFGNEDEFCFWIDKLYHDRASLLRMGAASQRLAVKYDIQEVLPQVVSIIENEYQKKNPF